MYSTYDHFKIKIYEWNENIMYLGKENLIIFKPNKKMIYGDIYIYEYNNRFFQFNSLKDLGIAFEDLKELTDEQADRMWVWDYFTKKLNIKREPFIADVFCIPFSIDSITKDSEVFYYENLDMTIDKKEGMFRIKYPKNRVYAALILLTRHLEYVESIDDSIFEDNGIKDEIDLLFFLNTRDEVSIKFSKENYETIVSFFIKLIKNN